MKVFHTILYNSGTLVPPAIVTDRHLVSPEPANKEICDRYASTILPTASFDHYNDEDFVKYSPNGTMLLGYLHGGEEVLSAVQTYVAERNTVRNTNFLEAQVITCGDDEHPCDTMSEPWFKRGSFYEKFDPDSWPPNWNQI